MLLGNPFTAKWFQQWDIELTEAVLYQSNCFSLRIQAEVTLLFIYTEYLFNSFD